MAVGVLMIGIAAWEYGRTSQAAWFVRGTITGWRITTSLSCC
jgi:hypothetical protein